MDVCQLRLPLATGCSTETKCCRIEIIRTRPSPHFCCFKAHFFTVTQLWNDAVIFQTRCVWEGMFAPLSSGCKAGQTWWVVFQCSQVFTGNLRCVCACGAGMHPKDSRWTINNRNVSISGSRPAAQDVQKKTLYNTSNIFQHELFNNFHSQWDAREKLECCTVQCRLMFYQRRAVVESFKDVKYKDGISHITDWLTGEQTHTWEPTDGVQPINTAVSLQLST